MNLATRLFIILKSKLEQKQELEMAEQCCPFGIGPKLAVVQVVQVVSKKAKSCLTFPCKVETATLFSTG